MFAEPSQSIVVESCLCMILGIVLHGLDQGRKLSLIQDLETTRLRHLERQMSSKGEGPQDDRKHT